ncbi:alpha/beta hydrolase [Pseudonocardia ailaonensis]|uniref:Alpha/beta hydrolase n=1 Tax=Pseudonocardia ailaonensis TaxID=367279 RepID=A0ABN2NMP2_9PSEU
MAHRRPREHWLWWLTEELRRRGEQALYPQFPAPERPSVDEWVELLHAELAQLGDRERVVVCHSLGCALWLRAARDLPAELRVDRVLLVSPLGAQAFTAENGNEEFRIGGVDREALAAGRVRVVVSATDPYAPVDPRGWSAGVDCDVLPDAGHITPAEGYGPWPGVLDWCLDERTPVAGHAER